MLTTEDTLWVQQLLTTVMLVTFIFLVPQQLYADLEEDGVSMVDSQSAEV